MKLNFSIILLFLAASLPVTAAVDAASRSAAGTARIVDPAERTGYLLRQCEILLRKSEWKTASEGNEVKGCKFKNGYDEISVRISAEKDGGFFVFTVDTQKNGKRTEKTFRVSGETASDDKRLSDLVLSSVIPEVLVREGLGDFKKAFTAMISFGYSRTRDDDKFYPVYAKGNIHIDWLLEYDPSSKVYNDDTTLTVGDYILFDGFFDWATIIRENYGNVDVLLYGKNRYSGNAGHGTRLMYGFFNGVEYFRPGFANTAMTWNREINRSQPAIQYAFWRALQGNVILSHRNGAAIYTASFMAGAGMGVGPSSLFATDISPEEEENLSHVFRSRRYRKQNYYFSYGLPARISLSADRLYDFYLEIGYKYCYFYPVLIEDMYDMLHVCNGMIGYYLSYDVMIASEYESWWVVSMMHDETRRHQWNRLIFEFKNFF
ncbi:MAG: hypothetical protein MUC95_01450 [Spirochaetes bacterium]|nr:hypothetical protein [Spirochaetota bacterium]